MAPQPRRAEVRDAEKTEYEVEDDVHKIVLHGRCLFYSECAKPARLLTGVTNGLLINGIA